MAKVFRFEDRRAAEAEHHLVELRDGKHYRMRTGSKDQPGDRAVRLHELLDQIRTLADGLTTDELEAQLESGEYTSADTRLLYELMASLIRHMFFEEVSDDVLRLHGVEDFRAIMDQYFLLWTPPGTDSLVTMIETKTLA